VSDRDRPLVSARGLRKTFLQRANAWSSRGRPVHALAGVDLTIRAGETLGLVGESGSGKSTLGRILVRLIDPDAGSLSFEGVDLLALRARELRRMRRNFQIVFQDPYGSLNPRMRVGTAIGEPLVIHRLVRSRAERRARVVELLEQVGLDAAAADRYPHAFSGGQRQRIGIARAIACSPKLVVADEPVSALDAPVQAQIVNLLMELQERLGLAYLLIAHDLRLVERIADRVAVMYLGRIVERGSAAQVYASPLHPYTRALLASTPGLRPGVPTPPALAGEPPSPADPPPGCPFHPRCPIAEEICTRVEPALETTPDGREVACHVAIRAVRLASAAAPLRSDG
jgi:oligopeptide/dipeptide ABC transporter ATP-binding protein